MLDCSSGGGTCIGFEYSLIHTTIARVTSLKVVTNIRFTLVLVFTARLVVHVPNAMHPVKTAYMSRTDSTTTWKGVPNVRNVGETTIAATPKHDMAEQTSGEVGAAPVFLGVHGTIGRPSSKCDTSSHNRIHA